MKKPIVSLAAALILLVPGFAEAQRNRVVPKIGKDSVEFTIKGDAAGTYRFKGVPKPIIWPILAPGEVKATRAWPMGKIQKSKDHPHHQSVWFCHGDVIPKGIKLKHKHKRVAGADFWSVNKGHGKIVCTNVKLGKSGAYWGGIKTTNEWRLADGRKILDEKRSVTLYDFGKARLWIFDIELIATICAIIFADNKEGSMAVRVHDQISMKYGNGMIQNSNGIKGERTTKDKKGAWGRHADWCDYSGKVNGKMIGIALFDDANNLSRAAYHVRGYGLMAANPFGRAKSGFLAVRGRKDQVEIAKGGRLRLRYGVLVHKGGTIEGNVAGYYKRFVRLGQLAN